MAVSMRGSERVVSNRMFGGGPLKRSLRKWFNVQMAFEDVEEVLEGIDFAVDDGGGEN